MTFDSAALHGLFASPFDAERWSAVLLDLFGVRHGSEDLKHKAVQLPRGALAL